MVFCPSCENEITSILTEDKNDEIITYSCPLCKIKVFPCYICNSLVCTSTDSFGICRICGFPNPQDIELRKQLNMPSIYPINTEILNNIQCAINQKNYLKSKREIYSKLQSNMSINVLTENKHQIDEIITLSSTQFPQIFDNHIFLSQSKLNELINTLTVLYQDNALPLFFNEMKDFVNNLYDYNELRKNCFYLLTYFSFDDNKNNEILLSLFSSENNIIHQYFCLYKRTLLLLFEMSKYIKIFINTIENNSINLLILQILFKIYKEIVLNTLIK